MMKGLTIISLVVAAIVARAQVGEAQLFLYDDFNLTKIDPTKWQGSEGSAGPNAPNTEAIRKITAKQLQLLLTSFGRTGSDIGIGGLANQHLAVTDPGSISAMQAKVTVKAPTTQGCPANPLPTRARVQIIGAFFNDGGSSGAGDRTGDILAGIQKVKDSITGSRIEAFINRCTNPTCSFPQPSLASRQFTAPWAVGVADVLRVEWRPASNLFHFALNPGTAGEEIASLSYSVPDGDPPVADFKQLAVANSVASCLASQKKASIIGFFDDVMVR